MNEIFFFSIYNSLKQNAKVDSNGIVEVFVACVRPASNFHFKKDQKVSAITFCICVSYCKYLPICSQCTLSLPSENIKES